MVTFSIANPVGASGVVAAVVWDTVALAPVPTELTAATPKSYDVAADNPVIVVVVPVETPSANVFQGVVPFAL